MKVIEHGTGQRGWSQKMKCTGKGNGNGGCGAVLLVEEPDVYQTTHSVRDETDYLQTFRCCECGHQTDFDNYIPFELHSETPEQKKRIMDMVAQHQAKRSGG